MTKKFAHIQWMRPILGILTALALATGLLIVLSAGTISGASVALASIVAGLSAVSPQNM